MRPYIPTFAEIRANQEAHQQGILARREARKAATAERHAFMRSLTGVDQRKAEREARRAAAPEEIERKKAEKAEWRAGAADRAKARQKERQITGMTQEEYTSWIKAKGCAMQTTRRLWFKNNGRTGEYFIHRPMEESEFPTPRLFWNASRTQSFATREELDEYKRGWREYREWCAENREAIRTAEKKRRWWEDKRIRSMLEAGFFSLEAYDAWLAERKAERDANHPLRKPEEHHVERRRIRDQWRNYRKQVKAGMAANGGRIPAGWMAKAFDEQGGLCALCAKELDRAVFEIDHIIPVSLGGPNEAWNLQLAHSICNIQKKDNPFVFMGM